MTNYIELAAAYIAEQYPTLVYAKPRLMDLPTGAIIGSWAYSIPGKIRFMLNRERELAPGVLPGDLARAYIRDQYTLPIRRRKVQMNRVYNVPLHAVRGSWGYCYYVDIKAAYLSVLGFGYDVEYRTSKYLAAEPRAIPPEIAASKFTYAITVAMSGSAISNFEVMGKDGLFSRKSFNNYSNPCLYILAQDTLNGIGAEMLAVLGEFCVYANTDGYIVKEGYEQYAIDIIKSWGFNAAIKYQGETIIRGVASYKIGDYQTRRFDPHSQDFTNLMMGREDRRWLKNQWQRWHDKLQSTQSASEQNKGEILP